MVIDVTPLQLPVLVNGGMTSRSIDKIKTRIHARAIVLSDEETQIAIVIADSCMMGRVLLDDAKALAAIRTGIPADRILIATARLLGAALVTCDERILAYAKQGHVRIVDATP